MEAHAASVDNVLIDGLQYKLKEGASYVLDRKSVTFMPTGSNLYAPSGTRILKFQLNGDGWVDPSTLRIMYDLHNKATFHATDNRLRPLGTPGSFFRRVRISIAGTLVEDFTYNRCEEMFNKMKPKEVRDNDDIEGFTYREDRGDISTGDMPGIQGGKAQTVSFRLMSGLFNQKKYLPLKYLKGGITIELEVVNQLNDCIADPDTGNGSTTFTTTNTTTEWEIMQCAVKVDLCQIDGSLENEYSKLLLGGGHLPLSYTTYITQDQTISGGDVSVNVSRAVSRLKAVFVTFFKEVHDDKHHKKEFNMFYHLMNGSNHYNPDLAMEIALQIGSKRYPQYPTTSLAECFANLRKVMGNHKLGSVSITPTQYHVDSFIFGIDCENVPEAGFTGLNTKDGQLLNVRAKAIVQSANNIALMPTSMTVTLLCDSVLQISDAGVSVFDYILKIQHRYK